MIIYTVKFKYCYSQICSYITKAIFRRQANVPNNCLEKHISTLSDINSKMFLHNKLYPWWPE